MKSPRTAVGITIEASVPAGIIHTDVYTPCTSAVFSLSCVPRNLQGPAPYTAEPLVIDAGSGADTRSAEVIGFSTAADLYAGGRR